MKRGFLSFFIVFFVVTAFAAGNYYEIKESVVVTATKEKTKKKDIAKNVKVVTKKEIEESGAITAIDALKNVPGVIIASNGGYGSPVSVYLRGASPNHTIVMIDGIKINDPMNPGRSADLSTILASDIERIEIVYGSESAVYGSDAMAGVINIITVSGKRTLNGFFEGGSKSTTSGGINFQNKQGKLFYWMKGSFFDTDGISAADEKMGNTESDSYTNATINGGLKYSFGKNELTASLIYIDTDSDLDNFGGEFGDNPSYTGDRTDYYGKFEWKYNNPFGFDGYTRFGYYYTSIERDYSNPDENFPPVVNSNYKGEFNRFNLHTFLKLSDKNSISFGLETTEEKGHSYYYSESSWGAYESIFPEKSVDTNSAYLNLISKFKFFTLNIGARYDDHDEFGSKGTFNLGFVVPLTETLVFKVNGGNGFKAPSLFQLYSDMYGNKDLKAETSDNYEAFFEKRLLEGKMVFTIGYFYDKYKDLIYFDMTTYRYANGEEAETKGMETTFKYAGKSFSWFFGFTNISYSSDNQAYFYNRPEATMNFGITYKYNQWNCNLTALYYDDRTSFDFLNFKEVKLDSFTVVDARIGYNLNKKLEIYLKGHNIFDEDYEYVYGYGTLGAVYYIGVRYKAF
ncbi:vitamin B12 transporter [Thermotomaculum hydrothermale]|uniref:Vitamin B12 transporter n=1 Tax=Thermotomaculum hydrothermale TaxID=981385 RepID=A0A7R6PLG0_9BACT|nr:TonB-dependent receptor [Thermotomaculum hydrothermale]BBB32272.1 vitamin B12 transporter [Thermotomaculum hydrothermale]